MPKLFEKIKTSMSCYYIKEYRLFGKSLYLYINNFLANEAKRFLFGMKIQEKINGINIRSGNQIIAKKTVINLNECNKNIKISIIVNLSNEETLSFLTIDSLLKQTYRNFEVVIIGEISENLILKQIRKLNAIESNIIIYGGATFYEGVRRSTGKYISFCDNNDYWSDNNLSKKIEIISSFDNPVAIVNEVQLFGDKRFFKYVLPIINTRKLFLNKKINRISDKLWKKHDFVISPSSWMIRKDALDKCDFSENTHPLLLNSWIWRQICPENDIFYISEKLTFMEISSEKVEFGPSFC